MFRQNVKRLGGRRSFLASTVGALGAAFWAEDTLEAQLQNTKTASKPTELRITDLRMAQVGRRGLIRIDTNQGIYGLGENRDGASNIFPMMLKRVIVGENPCDIDKIFRKIKQFGFHARQGGGVSGIEIALWDLAGKAYNIPIYQMLGGKFRNSIRVYCDTVVSPDPAAFAKRMAERKKDGFTWFKADVGAQILAGIPGTISYPAGADIGFQNPPRPNAAGGGRGAAGAQTPGPTNLPLVHMFTGMELTDKGIGLMAEYVAKLRDAVGYDIPLSTDHFGHFGVNSAIRLGKAFEKFNLAWMEDMIPWQYTDQLKEIKLAINVPLLTGEDIYLKEEFEKLCRAQAVDIIQPDLLTSGGILETKKIGDMAMELGVPMALHMAESPIACFAAVHCAAATENFLVLENHDVDNPEWGDLVDGVSKPIVENGFIKVPEGPGLGITINEAALKKQITEPGIFEPTPQWDQKGRVNDRLWS